MDINNNHSYHKLHTQQSFSYVLGIRLNLTYCLAEELTGL